MSGPDHAGRLQRARYAMRQQGIDALLLSVGADLPYLTGYRAMASERLTMAVIPAEGDAALYVPRLEAPRVVPRPDVFGLRAWEETEDPIALVAGHIGGRRRLAVGDQTWSVFLLRLQDALRDASFVPGERITAGLRLRKDGHEIEALRRAGAAADRVVARLAQTRFSGRTERDLASGIATMTVEEGHDAATFTIVASGPNGASPHHEPGERVIEPGDAVVVDFGGTAGGYHSDTTRNFVVGDAPDSYDRAYGALAAAQQAAVDAVRPGTSAESVDAAAREVIAAAGYGDHFVHRTGHGIGLDVHEEPYIVAGNRQELDTGMAFSVEPGIYLAGRFGMRIEDIVVVGDEGAERLNRSERAYAVVA